MIRREDGMTTARFTRLIGVPERSYRRWQQRQRLGRPVKGPWPSPSADRIEPTAVAYADRYPQRKIQSGLLRSTRLSPRHLCGGPVRSSSFHLIAFEHGDSLREIATRLGCSVTTVHRRVHASGDGRRSSSALAAGGTKKT